MSDEMSEREYREFLDRMQGEFGEFWPASDDEVLALEAKRRNGEPLTDQERFVLTRAHWLLHALDGVAEREDR